METFGGSAAPIRTANYCWLRDPKSGEQIDQCLTLFFAAPDSATGEDVAELHLHGGSGVIAAVIGSLARLDGLRLAEPGEFTRRAFEHGKFDLTQAEAVADLIDAETKAQRRQAVRQLDGKLGNLYRMWIDRLVVLLAHAEATLDFPDEELPEDLDANFHFDINAISTEIAQHLDDGSRGERLRDGFYVAIVGAPNVGKSTLLNCLAGREAAIVSETAGTTRDVIEVHLDLGGYPVTFADTAGLRVAESEVEEEGVRRARDRAAKADLTLAVFDASLWPKRDPETLGIVEKSGAPGAVITVLNKVDLAAPKQTAALDSGTVAVSAVQGTGIDDLLAGITGAAEESFSGAAATPALTRTRHRSALEDCVEALNRAASVEGEVLAEDLRLAVRSLGRITGAVDVEDLLDRIFAEFCIGK